MMIGYSQADIDRFFKHVDRRNDDECWDWVGSKNPKGYGNFWIGNKITSAHRFSYFMYCGNFDFNLCVCHSCDNRSCVNPSHLFLGTQTDNMKDMVDKKRSSRGENQFGSILKEYMIESIRKRYSEGETGVSLGLEYGVSKGTISAICRGEKWAWADGIITNKGHSPRKIEKEKYKEIKDLYSLGMHTMCEIAKIYNLSYTTINKIIHYEDSKNDSNS